jgi:hypothetical protein
MDGQHLSPGAVYETHDDDAKMLCTVHRWERMRGVHVEITRSEVQLSMALDGRMTGVERPREVALRGAVGAQGGERRWLTQVEDVARVDLVAWWRAAAGKRTSGTPVAVTIGAPAGSVQCACVAASA